MKVLISKAAEADLQEIILYISADSLVAAERFYRAMLKKFRAIADHPLIYPSREEILPGLRVCPIGSYNIYFRVDPQSVLFVRVLHSAQNQSSAVTRVT